MKDLHQITVIGLGLLGSSATLAINSSGLKIKTAAYSHRASTRKLAEKLEVVGKVYDSIEESVENADMVILATPICTFEEIFKSIAPHLKKNAIVTDVGSTKLLPHKWAKKQLPKTARYVGSHPIAGSEQRGVEFARDDLFNNAACLITRDAKTNPKALRTVKKLWAALNCRISVMTPQQHDKIMANVSHLPHALAASLLNAADFQQLKFCGKGFIDSSRVASGPANVWADIFYTNSANIAKGIDKTITELKKLKMAIKNNDKKQIEKLLALARQKRAKLIDYKVKKKEIL